MVKQEEGRPDLFGLLEDLRQGREGDEDSLYLPAGIPDLKTRVVPVFGQGARSYPLYGLGYLSYAHHLGAGLYNGGPWISYTWPGSSRMLPACRSWPCRCSWWSAWQSPGGRDSSGLSSVSCSPAGSPWSI